MPRTAHAPNTFHLSYDPTTNRLLGQWPTTVADAHLRTHYAYLLSKACEHGNCRFWLLDLSKRNWHTPGFGRWFGTVFAQAAQAALHQPLFIAYVLSPNHQVISNTPGVQATKRDCAAHGVYLLFFDSETAASEWLAYQQTHGVDSAELN
jgi:hypothetical protein